MTDQLDELFADLRTQALPQVRPPGAEAARHTVRRRRRRTRTAAAVVLAVAGGVVTAGLLIGGEHRVQPAERTKGLVETAKRALDKQLPYVAGRPMSGGVETGGAVTFADLAPGRYMLAVTCAGPGVLTVDAELVRGPKESSLLGGQVVSCTDAPQVAVMTFRLPVKGPVVVSADGDARAAGNSGYALELADGDATGSGHDTVPAAESTWNASRASDVLKAAGTMNPMEVTAGQTTTEGFSAVTGLAQPPGDYDFQLVCAGPGSLSLTVMAVPVDDGVLADTGSVLMSGQVECSDTDPVLDETGTLTLPEDSGFLIIAVPDQQARDRAGWAYRLSPA
jgi:hypothetical protein